MGAPCLQIPQTPTCWSGSGWGRPSSTPPPRSLRRAGALPPTGPRPAHPGGAVSHRRRAWPPVLVIDQPASIAGAGVHHRSRAGHSGGLHSRASDAPRPFRDPREAKTDARHNYLLVDTAGVHRAHIAWLDITDELLHKLRVLSGYSDDLAPLPCRCGRCDRDRPQRRAAPAWLICPLSQGWPGGCCHRRCRAPRDR